MWNHLSRW